MIMNTVRILTLGLLIIAPSIVFCQPNKAIKSLDFKLEQLSDNQTWGVFVVPGENISPTAKTRTGAGQVTIVAPVGFSYSNLRCHGGSWIENARVNSPMEAPGKAYISFGFVADEPKIMLIPNEPTLLFTFTTTEINSRIHLIDNINDPFAAPNSYGSNPGNDLGILDFGHPNGMMTYAFNDKAGADSQGFTQPVFTKNPVVGSEVKVIFTKEHQTNDTAKKKVEIRAGE
mgnify:CR=1 FL=1